MSSTAAPLGVSILAAFVVCLAPSPAAADCMDTPPACAATLPVECIQQIGAEPAPEGSDCDAALAGYLGCVDAVLISCAADARAMCREARETALWRDTRRSRILDDLDFFLSLCPESRFRSIAEARIELLKQDRSAEGAAAPISDELQAMELAALRERQAWFAREVEGHRAGVAGMKSELEELLSRAELARRSYERILSRNADGAAPPPELAAAEAAASDLDARYQSFARQFEIEQADQNQYEKESLRLERDIAEIEREAQ